MKAQNRPLAFFEENYPKGANVTRQFVVGAKDGEEKATTEKRVMSAYELHMNDMTDDATIWDIVDAVEDEKKATKAPSKQAPKPVPTPQKEEEEKTEEDGKK